MADENLAPYVVGKFHFQVSWGDTTIVCSEVSGLNVTQEPIEYRDGKTFDFFPRKRPGLQKFDDVVLKKGVFIEDEDFKEWYERVFARDGEDVYREDVTIVLMNESHEPVITWTLHNAWVSKWETPDMNSTANEAAIESVTLVYEKMTNGFPEDDGTGVGDNDTE